MSYLLNHSTRSFGARVDERLALNRPGLYGDAYVRVFVEDTSGRRVRRRPPFPHLRLRVADCTNEITLEFDLDTAELRANALFKADTLIGALQRFRDGLAAEAELYAQREQALRGRRFRFRRKEALCRI